MPLMESLKSLDRNVLLFINGKRHPVLDIIMFWVSNRWIWIPFYAFLLGLTVRIFAKKTVMVILTAGVLITITDQGSVHLFKNIFHRLRPCHNPQIASLIRLTGDCGGQYGFISSHSANVFALAMFMTFILRHRIRYLPLIMFGWATLVSYSRIYNGVHYPADIAAGALWGMATGYAAAKILSYFITISGHDK